MQETFYRKLYAHLREHYPDLLWTLQSTGSVAAYLKTQVAALEPCIDQWLSQDEPPAVIKERYWQTLTESLGPSRYDYLYELLEESFPHEYERLHKSGTLTTEIINLVAACKPVFDQLNFSVAAEEDRLLRYAIAGTVQTYFDQDKSEQEM